MILLNFKYFRKRSQASEEAIASKASISRITVRQIESGQGNPTLDSLNRVADSIGTELCVFLVPKDVDVKSDQTTVASSLNIVRDGFDSWPIHLMEMVDEFRKTADIRLLLLPPVQALNPQLKALFASTVCALCDEVGLASPPWAKGNFFLPEPWFLSETESLKALAIRDSPLPFRRNNIFVLDNFLKRA